MFWHQGHFSSLGNPLFPSQRHSLGFCCRYHTGRRLLNCPYQQETVWRRQSHIILWKKVLRQNQLRSDSMIPMNSRVASRSPSTHHILSLSKAVFIFYSHDIQHLDMLYICAPVRHMRQRKLMLRASVTQAFSLLPFISLDGIGYLSLSTLRTS